MAEICRQFAELKADMKARASLRPDLRLAKAKFFAPAHLSDGRQIYDPSGWLVEEAILSIDAPKQRSVHNASAPFDDFLPLRQ